MEYSNSQIREIIGEFIHSERDRAIAARKLVDDITFEQLAEDFNMSVSQIKRIVYRCASIVFRHVPG